jgi:predicted short-subunit dehydrogenase-like oxidoreductase (DUF2520 family)
MDPNFTDPSCVPASVSVVGAGRLGTALAGALRAAGLEVRGPVGRGEPVPPADAVLLCVPDSEIPDAARAAGGAAPLIGHCSGATPIAELGPGGFGLHPLQTFVGGEGPDRFRDAGCAVAGATPGALAAATALARALGMHPFEIDDSGRAAYHAAASIASNFLVTLEDAAERVAAGAGLDPADTRRLLAPLVRSTVENWAARGPERALTGPIARGDEATVDRQREAVAEVAPELLALFDEMADRTRALTGVAV